VAFLSHGSRASALCLRIESRHGLARVSLKGKCRGRARAPALLDATAVAGQRVASPWRIILLSEGSERAEIEARVRELERELDACTAFLGTVGHELRNPLSPIFMQAQYMLDSARQARGDTVSADWLIGQLESLCDRMRKFIAMLNRITDVARIGSGQLDLDLESVDFRDVVCDVVAGFEREALTARSALQLTAPHPLIGTWDRLRLSQIVANLVSNAIRYGAGKPIEISLNLEGEHARLEVRDHGIGIAPEDHERVFQRFERAAQRSRTGGFGIGLWIVRESCRAMGGSVELKSASGQGSSFTVRLPRDRSERTRHEHE
jgi:signal transduction histidine kinase